jgi:hypothetical protein
MQLAGHHNLRIEKLINRAGGHACERLSAVSSLRRMRCATLPLPTRKFCGESGRCWLEWGLKEADAAGS